MKRKTTLKLDTCVCRVDFPRRSYQDETHHISLKLDSHPQWTQQSSHSLRSNKTPSDDEVLLQVAPADQFIEVELLAAGLTIDGEKKQRRPLASNLPLEYWWSCHFPHSGIQEFLLLLKAVDASSIERPVGIIHHKCTVTKYDHLTQHDLAFLSIFAKIAGFVALILTIVLSIAQVAHVAGFR